MKSFQLLLLPTNIGWLLSLLLLLPNSVNAMFADEAGKLDFRITSAGHGPVQFVKVLYDDNQNHHQDTAIITAEYNNKASTCFVASRKSSDASLLWRRNVCSTSHYPIHLNYIVASGNTVVTIDNQGFVTALDASLGTVLWSATFPESTMISLATAATNDSKEYVIVDGKTVLDALTGSTENVPSSNKLTAVGETPLSSLEVNCPELSLVAHFQESLLLSPLENKKQVLTAEKSVVTKEDIPSAVHLVACTTDTFSVLVTTVRGTTAKITFSTSNDNNNNNTGTPPQVNVDWKVQEGLSAITSALLLDASHYVSGVASSSSSDLLLLDWTHRLQSQWTGLLEFFTTSTSTTSSRDHIFGFVKIALLLAPSVDRVFGVETAGTVRGRIRYQLDLPLGAEWHRMVHGTFNSESGAHGINGVTHNRDILILSSFKDALHFCCFDGSSGNVHSQGSLPLSAPVAQIIPLVGSGTCRQGALVVTRDHAVHAIANTATRELLSSSTGFYTHIVDKEKGSVSAMRISPQADSFKLSPVGTANFAGESLVATAYPSREEVVQSPCKVLGDDSLLLKYLNPHIAVFVTMKTDDAPEDEFTKAVKLAKKTSKRKPAGVSQDPTAEEGTAPNLFVNVVDTVSGRILYRASHENAGMYPKPSVVISENWVVYSFVNEKTRRAEVGVLSLYEGMIDSKGITAFTSPDQTESFSSMDARTAKPVVLAKTFSIAKPGTAMGMTMSRGGVSTQNLLLATLDGQVTVVERKVIDPRRPIGELKESEKKEGLRQYTELIPIVSLMSLSYNLTVEGVTSIVSAPTHLESQSLVLAYGGPDIFFTRTSPSRGFDLLPESFNKIILSIVVGAVFVLLLVVQRMVSKKVQKAGWV